MTFCTIIILIKSENQDTFIIEVQQVKQICLSKDSHRNGIHQYPNRKGYTEKYQENNKSYENYMKKVVPEANIKLNLSIKSYSKLSRIFKQKLFKSRIRQYNINKLLQTANVDI